LTEYSSVIISIMGSEKIRSHGNNEDQDIEQLKRVIANYKHQIEILKKIRESNEEIEKLTWPDSHFWLY